MEFDQAYERAIQQLLDGEALAPTRTSADDPRLGHLLVIDQIARTFRTAIFGRDISPNRPTADRWGHLEVRGEIGRGASGTVYRAWDPRLQREVALKLFDPGVQNGEGALEEGRLLARLNHPHIVRVFGADSHESADGLWMELLEGDTLDVMLERDGLFSGEEALLIGLDLARALAAVHAEGLLHRDVKSRNVLRERAGRIVLMDLGAGRRADQPGTHREGTGTPMYMAPEVLAGGPATAQSDLYCLGVLLFRLVSGTYPVTAPDIGRLRAAHVAGERAGLATLRPDLAAPVAEAIERCAHPDRALRYQSALELETALIEALRTTLAERAAVRSLLVRRWCRWRGPAAIAATLLAGTLLAAWGMWDTNSARAVRRRVGLIVPPRSTLYLSMNAALGIVRGRHLSFHPNPTTAAPIAASRDLGVVTVAGTPPWTTGGRFGLDGSPTAPMPTVNADLCCFVDGATDGAFNYSVRSDSTLLEPMGARPLAPPGLYRFRRDWSNPELLFPLRAEGTYLGIAYSAVSRTFWLTRKAGSTTVIEEWSHDGRHLRTPVESPATLVGLAIDPRDDTLWAVRAEENIAAVVRLENFDRTGRHIAAVELSKPDTVVSPLGAEFEWIGRW